MMNVSFGSKTFTTRAKLTGDEYLRTIREKFYIPKEFHNPFLDKGHRVNSKFNTKNLLESYYAVKEFKNVNRFVKYA